MLTIENRIEAALLQVIAVGKNFNRKSDPEVIDILRNWGIQPKAITSESACPLTVAINEFIQTKEQLAEIVKHARLISQQINLFNINQKRNIPTDTHARALVGVDTESPYYRFYQVLTRKDTYKAGPYCWDTGQILGSADNKHKFDAVWLLIGPATGLRQGKLKATQQDLRIITILKGVPGETET